MLKFSEFISESSFKTEVQKIYDEIEDLKKRKSESENDMEKEKLQASIYKLEKDINILSNKEI